MIDYRFEDKQKSRKATVQIIFKILDFNNAIEAKALREPRFKMTKMKEVKEEDDAVSFFSLTSSKSSVFACRLCH